MMFNKTGLVYFYGLMCILGIILPYAAFLPWVLENGIHITRLITDAFSNRISLFAWLDVIVAAIVLIVFILVEGARLGIKKRWLPIVATLTVGVSFGLPLFLLLRQVHINNKTDT